MWNGDIGERMRRRVRFLGKEHPKSVPHIDCRISDVGLVGQMQSWT
jgi:hypothetical protein